MVKALALASLLALTACQTAKGSFCDHAKPIRLSDEIIDALPPEKVNEFLAQNKKGERFCGWRP